MTGLLLMLLADFGNFVLLCEINITINSENLKFLIVEIVFLL